MCARRCAKKRSGWRGCCSRCFPASRKSWASPRSFCSSMRARRRGSTPTAPSYCLDDQDRRLWDRDLIAEGFALIDKAVRHRRPGPYQIQAAIAGVHAHATSSKDTDWSEIDQLYATLERLQPSPVVTLNRAVAVNKVQGPAAALAMIEPLAEPLAGYFHFFGVKGGLLDAARPRQRGPGRLRPGDRARPHAGGSRSYPRCISTG